MLELPNTAHSLEGSQVESDKGVSLPGSAPIPKVFRTMKRDDDGSPTVEPTAKGLGARLGHDINVDLSGNVVLNDKGLSVSPSWRELLPYRIPKRLKHLYPPARGGDDVHCFTMGTGAFLRSAVAQGLEFIPDSLIHGVIAPAQAVPLSVYQTDLGATRSSWQVDET